MLFWNSCFNTDGFETIVLTSAVLTFHNVKHHQRIETLLKDTFALRPTVHLVPKEPNTYNMYLHNIMHAPKCYGDSAVAPWCPD